MEFREWINQRYVEWRGDAVGHERTISDYAAWIGVSQPVMSRWMSGSKPRNEETINALVARYGPEVYDVLGIKQTKINRTLHQAQAAYNALPPEEQQAFLDRINQVIQDTYQDFHGKRVK